MKTQSILLLCLFLTSVFALKRTYQNTLQLSAQYNLSWNIQGDTIQLALQVATTGWVGFGIGEPTSGSMPGADIVTGTVFDNGTASIQDRYALIKGEPTVDDCQNWVLISGQINAGITSLEVERKLVTNDGQQDRPIVAGPTRILFAFGTSTTFAYHGTNRHLGVIYFIPDNTTAVTSALPANVSSIDFIMNNYTIPAVGTTYACQSFILPIGPQTPDNHIIQIDPIVNPATAQFVHHFVVQRCDANSSIAYVQSLLQNPGSCFPSPCLDYIWAWAPGMGPLILPPVAGFRFGNNPGDIKNLVLQVHYNNPGLVAGQVDVSGFRIHYTPILRQFDAGVLQLGDPAVKASSIAPGIVSNPFEFNCPSECTSIWPQDLTVFADFLHMHQIGKQMYTTHWRNNTYLGVLNRVDFYQFELQQTTTINTVIKRGDRLNTHCIYDSSLQTITTTFGLQSQNEMCIDFVYYYPALLGGDCGFYRYANQNLTICAANQKSPILPLTNPTISDGAVLPITFGTPFNGVCSAVVTSTTPLATSTVPSATVPRSSSSSNRAFVILTIMALILSLF